MTVTARASPPGKPTARMVMATTLKRLMLTRTSYGYDGYYVDLSEYQYYFREGFRRGYEDGYYSRSRYGRYSNGSASILGTILESILGLQLLN
jgi:hypothetical protein